MEAVDETARIIFDKKIELQQLEKEIKELLKSDAVGILCMDNYRAYIQWKSVYEDNTNGIVEIDHKPDSVTYDDLNNSLNWGKREEMKMKKKKEYHDKVTFYLEHNFRDRENKMWIKHLYIGASSYCTNGDNYILKEIVPVKYHDRMSVHTIDSTNRWGFGKLLEHFKLIDD